MLSQLRIVLVDDHQMFREGLRDRLTDEAGMQVVGEATTGGQAMKVVEETYPSIVIQDIRLPDMSGIELAQQLRARWPDLKILVVTAYDYPQYVRAMARIGVQGYLLKESPRQQVVDALNEIAKGGTVLPPLIASKVIQSFADSAPRHVDVQELTVREIEIVELLHEGLRNAEIAERLSISARTVETHVGNIITKLGAQNRTEAVRIATERYLKR